MSGASAPGSDAAGGRPWSRSERQALLALAVLVLAVLPLLVHPWFDATNDGAVYLLTARALAAGEGYALPRGAVHVAWPGALGAARAAGSVGDR